MTRTAAPSAPTGTAFDPTLALDALLADVGLSAADAGGRVTFAGQDPIIAARHRLGAAIGIPMMGNAVAAAAMHRLRGGPGQDLHLDLRQAVHHINPSYRWKPTLAGEFPSVALLMDNPFSLAPYRTRDGRTVMASAVYPHQTAQWCRFLDVPPDFGKAAAAIAAWDAFELEEAANAAGLPACVARTPQEWLAHPHGALLASRPVIGLTRIGDAPPRTLAPSDRPFGGVRVLSFTHAVAGPTVGRVLAEQGAEVLGATRPNDFEHDWVYFEANIGSRSAWLDLTKDTGRADVDRLLRDAHVVVDNHRGRKLEKLGIAPGVLAETHPGLVHVSVTCYGSDGPWADRGGFDMNGSAASGLMAIEGGDGDPALPPTGLINDFITGYMGALGAAAGLIRQQREGGSWHVTVSLTRNAMWYQTLGLVDPADAGSDDEHTIREPEAYDADSPMGRVHMLAAPVTFSHTPARWPDPILVPRGSSAPRWVGIDG
ncbi:CoA transferase [Tsukamurella soli]|uniref:CoA transferase n=1 Tax=Tsukamurella soli TaxID=644556 RepID=A0ABP8K5X7_9ACTN